MVSPGRNDPCTCGCKHKYKHCCGRLSQNRFERQQWIDSSGTLRGKNLALLGAAADIFDLNRPWDTIKRRLCGAQVKEFYEFIGRLWPLSTDLLPLLPEPGSSLRALYLGEYAPELIVKNVCRFGLYADEILLINPFENPNRIAEQYNPLVHPEEWVEDTLRMLFQLLAMAPWVEKGFVTFIPNPCDFDRSLFQETVKSAEQRLTARPVTTKDIDDSIFHQHAMQKLFSCPPDYIERTYREINPNATDEEVSALIKYAEAQRLSNPFLTGETMDKMPAQFITSRTGANLETGMYLCQATGAFPYTNVRYRWEEILGARDRFDSTSETWTPLTKAFQGLDFKFLDHVSSKFAYTMRQEERLSGFRAYLRKVWKAVEGSPDPGEAERFARDFKDELTQSYQQAKKEWDDIDLDLLKWFGGGGIVAGATAAVETAFSNGKLSLALPAAGFVLNSVAQLIQARVRRRNFRKTVPMSAFIDLEKEKSGLT